MLDFCLAVSREFSQYFANLIFIAQLVGDIQ